MRIGLFWRVMPAYMVVIALFALPLWQRHTAEAQIKQDIAIYENSPHHKIDRYAQGTPVKIIIPRIGISLPVILGVYNTDQGSWSVSETKANYAFNTVRNNNKSGSTLIYGHWTQQVFGPTNNLRLKDKVIVITDNGHKFTYVYKNDETLNPTDTDLFTKLESKEPRLALMTCKGLWSQERRVMYFDLEGVE